MGIDKFSVAWCQPVGLMQVVGREGSVVVSASSVRNNALLDLTFITDFYCLNGYGGGGFLISYSNSHIKYARCQLQRFHDYFLTKHYLLN